MNPFPKARRSRFEGWNSYVLAGHQMAATFRSREGQLQHGIFALTSKDGRELEGEVTVPDEDCVLRFAVVDTSARGWEPAKTAAFRQDMDFYIFTHVNADAEARLRSYFVVQNRAPALCLVTALAVY